MLVADDHDSLRRLLVAMLQEHARLDVVADTGSGAEAVRLAIELQPDVALLDATMPGLGGLDAARAIHEGSPGVAVVIFSGSPPTSTSATPGVLAWLTKGEPMRDTIDRLLAVLDEHRGASP